MELMFLENVDSYEAKGPFPPPEVSNAETGNPAPGSYRGQRPRCDLCHGSSLEGRAESTSLGGAAEQEIAVWPQMCSCGLYIGLQAPRRTKAREREIRRRPPPGETAGPRRAVSEASFLFFDKKKLKIFACKSRSGLPYVVF